MYLKLISLFKVMKGNAKRAFHYYTPGCVSIPGFFEYGKHPDIIGPVLKGVYDDVDVSIISVDIERDTFAEEKHGTTSPRMASNMIKSLLSTDRIDVVVTAESHYQDARNYNIIKELWKAIRGTPIICLVPDESGRGPEEIKKKYVNHRMLGIEVIDELDAKKLRERLDAHLRGKYRNELA